MFNVVFINIIGKNMKRFFALAVLGIMFSSCSNSVYVLAHVPKLTTARKNARGSGGAAVK